MKQADDRAEKNRIVSNRKRRGLRRRRVAAAAVLSLAAGLGVVAFSLKTSFASILTGVGAALMLPLALVLCLRRFKPGVFCVLLTLDVLCFSMVVMGHVNEYYAWSDGRLVPRYALTRYAQVTDAYPEHFSDMESLETLDMRDSTVTDFTPIRAMTQLKRLDVRGNAAFTREEFEALSEALPDCDIHWNVPVGDTYFDSARQAVDLTDIPLDAAQLKDLLERYPDKRFTYLVPLMGRRYAPDVETLDLRYCAADREALAEALPLLSRVREIDLRGLPVDRETIQSFSEAWPEIHFLFSCDVPSGFLTTEDSEMAVSGGYDELTAWLDFVPCLPNLTRIDATAVELTFEQLDEVLASEYADMLLYSVTAFGRQIPCTDAELNLDNIPIACTEEVEACLARLPALQRISMCDCGLSEDEMGRLFDAHPDVKFVWWVEFGKYRVRTDATAFTTDLWDGNYYHYNDETFAPLRYCTDLMMLDLGHNEITSLETFRGLTKIRVLILADNQITDLSPLEGMNDLEFVELFLNYITDLSPLMGKEKLVDLNVFYNQLSGCCEQLKSMTSLKRLWVGHCHLSDEQLAELREALPDTTIVSTGHGSTGNGWREHPHYDTLVRMYKAEEYIPFDD